MSKLLNRHPDDILWFERPNKVCFCPDLAEYVFSEMGWDKRIDTESDFVELYELVLDWQKEVTNEMA
jgi:hypothetical protein